jgi:hypothetical protein
VEDKLQKSKLDVEYKDRIRGEGLDGFLSFCLFQRGGVTFIDEGIPSFTTKKQNYIITKVKVSSKNTSL